MAGNAFATIVRSCFCSLATALVAVAQDGVAGSVTTIDGRTLVGALRVAADGKAELVGKDGTVALQVAELATFERTDAVAARVEVAHRLWLRSGGELPVVRFGGDPAADGKPATLRVETPSGLSLAFPLGTVRALRHGGLERPEPNLFRADLDKPSANDDLLYVLKDGKAQRSLVTVTGLRSDGVDFLLRGDAYEFELKGLAAVVFGANTGLPPDRQQKPRVRLELCRGEAFDGRLLGLDATSARLRLDEGVEVVVPSAQLLRFTVQSDRLAWLGDLKPTITQTPAFDRTWPPTFDRSLGGAGFVVAGKRFARGVGLVPRTRLDYELGGRFDVFEATIGIDDRGGAEANAVFRVLVDGKVAWESAAKKRGDAAEVVRVPLQKAQRFAIEVDFGADYDLGDHCVFADARVLQQ
jgi:hypothetical protein